MRKELIDRSIRSALQVMALLALATPAASQTARNVAVIINEASEASVEIGEYYVSKRAIPAENVIRITTSTDDEMSRGKFNQTIEVPIAAALNKRGLQDRILYFVVTKGIPLRITGTSGPNGTTASVDSELTLLYRKMTGQPSRTAGRVDNPYFLGTRPMSDAGRFSRREYDIYLVTRLDAFTVEEAKAVIDRAQSPEASGRVVMDERATSSEAQVDGWLKAAAGRLGELGLKERVVLDTSAAPVRDVEDVLGYYSWGSNDSANRVRRFGMDFAPGAIAATFVSTDGRTFSPPPDDWVPSNHWTSGRTLFAGTPQNLAGDLIREGATGVAANVAEPYLSSAVRPQILFPAYFSGFNLVESFYLAMPHIGWQTVVVGDPLCAPFRRELLAASEIEEPVDPSTELPGLFSQRRAKVLSARVKDVAPDAIAAALLAESRTSKGDEAGARTALEKAAEAGPSFAGVQLQLALIHQEAGDFPAAAKRYRLVLETQPDNAVALNNLAFGLAVDMKSPQEARPYALRASALAPKDLNILDTLAWIEYLLGNNAEAARLIAKVTAGIPNHLESRLHAAFIYAAVERWKEADAELQAALKLDAGITTRPEVRELQARISERLAKIKQ